MDSHGSVNFIYLLDLLNSYPPDLIKKIKDQYLVLLSELTSTNDIETKLFIENVERIHSMGAIIVGYIGLPNDDTFEIVSSGTIILEPKIIRDCKMVGHIEDIVVAKSMRAKGVSQHILKILKNIARENNCYKVILNCSEELKQVYLKNGFEKKGLCMVEYFG